MKHQHFDFIVPWAEGVTIVQGRSLLAQVDSKGAEWFDLPIDWDWSQECFEYRLKPEAKPEPVKQTLYIYSNLNDDISFISKDKLLLQRDWEYMGSIEVTK